MQDRAPLYPGRVKLIPVSGQTDVYDMVRADEPTQDGTALNKANLLTDVTAALFGLGTDAVPNDVLVKIKDLIDVNAEAIANGTKIATGSYKGTGTYGSSNPCKLTFDFVPKLVIVFTDQTGLVPYDDTRSFYNSFIWVIGQTQTSVTGDSSTQTNRFTTTGNIFSWYGQAPLYQLNESGKSYSYICIG